MKVHKRFGKQLVLIAMMALCMLFMPMQASAEVQEADFINHEGGDLAFSFFYEADVPDLVFISPSGVEYAEGVTSEAELVIGRGEGWSSYRIPGAEAGQWRLRYDKRNNATIEYVEVKPVEAIAIQSFALTGVEGDMATVTFLVRKGDANVTYQYTIDLMDEAGNIVKSDLAWGRGETLVEQTAEVRLEASTGSGYQLVLNVSHNDGEESFDSAKTDAFTYTNPNTPVAIADFTVQLNSERSRCTVDWYDYRPGGWGYTYSIMAIADGDRENPIYAEENLEETQVSFFYPVDASKLEVEVFYVKNGIRSEIATKTIDLTGSEYLKIATEDVVSEALLRLEYSVKNKTELKVTVNGVEGAYLIEGEGELNLTLQSGSNQIEAAFVGANNMEHSVSKEVFYTWVSPTIRLFEDLDGMTFKAGNVPVAGKVEEAVTVKVNGVETEIAEDGSFYCEVPIVEGKNTITVEAVSSVGVSSVQTVTVIGEGKGSVPAKPEDTDTSDETDGNQDDKKDSDAENTGDESGLIAIFRKCTSAKWFPTAVVAAISLVVLIFFFVTLRDKKKKGFAVRLKNTLIGFGVSEVLLGVAYFFLCRFNNSLQYVELAQESVQKAAFLLNCETYGKYVLLGVGGVIVLLILAMLSIAGLKKLKVKNAEKREQKAVLKAEKAAAKAEKAAAKKNKNKK